MQIKSIENNIYEPAVGYDLVADFFDQSDWSDFWHDNESLLVKKWLFSLPKGLGLDAGSGTGTYLPLIVESKNKCFALDVSKEMLKISHRKFINKLHYNYNIKYVVDNIDALKFKSNFFDWILCTRVLSHYNILEVPFEQFYKVLKKGGQIFISDIHPDHPYTETSFKTSFGKVRIKTYKHVINDIIAIAVGCGFKIIQLVEYDLTNISKKPDPIHFIKLYSNPENKIFYTLILEK